MHCSRSWPCHCTALCKHFTVHKLTQSEQSVLYTNCNSHLFSDLCTANCQPWAARDCAHLIKLIRSPQSIRGNSKKGNYYASLFCTAKLCKTKVSCEKKTRVEIHRSGHVHQREIGQLQLTPVVNFIIPNTTTKFVSDFLRANIPLHKLRHPALKELFTELRVDYPSESAARRAVQPIHEKNLDTIRSLIKDKDVTIICDESPIDGTKYAHVSVAEVGEIPYLVACKEIEKANSTSQSDDPIRTYLVHRLKNMQDLMDIISCTTGLSPEKTAKLRGAVGSSASIERSSSKLGKLLAKDRNFNAKNVEAYICVYCNNL